MLTDFDALGAELARVSNQRRVGRVTAVGTAALEIAGLSNHARIGDQVAIGLGGGAALGGEVVGISEALARAMTYAPLDGAAVGDAVTLLGPAGVHPAESWVGRIVDAFGQPLDGRPLAPGAASATLRRAPPPPATRKGLGARLATGLAVFDTDPADRAGAADRGLRGVGHRQVDAARRPRARHRGGDRGLCADRRAGAGAARLRRQRAWARREWSAPLWWRRPRTRRR